MSRNPISRSETRRLITSLILHVTTKSHDMRPCNMSIVEAKWHPRNRISSVSVRVGTYIPLSFLHCDLSSVRPYLDLPDMPSYLTLSITSIIAFLLLKTLKRRSKTDLPLPPGPKGGWPLIGNLLQMPRTYEHETYQRWCKETGECLISSLIQGLDCLTLCISTIRF
jgi:hypothetical protein